jgi:hypothetical protein
VLDKPSEKDKPVQLWVRTGTFSGDSKALDLQVFTESRYVPADALKNALEKLPQEHQYHQPLPKRDVVLSAEQQEAIRPLMGRWEQVTREGQGYAFWFDCRANRGTRLRLEWHGGVLKVRRDTQEEVQFDVGGVQLARDGSITLKMVTGETLKHARSRDDKRVSSWTGGLADGLFVHDEVKGDFPTVEPAPGECDE